MGVAVQDFTCQQLFFRLPCEGLHYQTILVGLKVAHSVDVGAQRNFVSTSLAEILSRLLSLTLEPCLKSI